MALPKKIKKDIDIKVVDPQGGPKNWTSQFLEQNKQFLPRDVDFEDLDLGFVEFVKDDLGIVIDGEKIPVHFLTLQRWNEFAKLWPNTDKYKNLTIPFVSIVRRPNPEVGTNPADFKIPVRKNFPYMQIPVWDGNRKGSDIYTIPNPVGVDLIYNVRFFTFKMRELNKLHKKVLQNFASAQAYINVKGHYFPMLLESIGDESQIDDLEGKRFYVQTYEIRLQGYFVDSEEFEVKPAISRAFITTEVDRRKPKPIFRSILPIGDDKTVRYIFQFLPTSSTDMTSNTVTHNIQFNTPKTTNIASYTIYVNNTQVQLPFVVDIGDVVKISVVKIDTNLFGEVELFGEKIC